jgi:NAD(P)-dependent dehydrogenase (short-subunit alcohol dehydrogenase family)
MMSKNSFDLSGHIALVTGASSGFGEHFAKVLAGAGARVVVGARRVERLQALVQQIEAAGGKALAVALDVNDKDSVTAAFDAAEAAFGTIDVLVNNAGVASTKRFIKTTEEDWDYVIDTNLKAVWRVARVCTERLVAANKPGSIVNIASMLGLHPSFAESLYGVSKAGVVHLTQNMAMELMRNKIRVNALCPGYFETEMNSDFFATDKGKEFIEKLPPKRLGELDELTAPLLLLASDAGSFINGVALPVDGGHLTMSL